MAQGSPVQGGGQRWTTTTTATTTTTTTCTEGWTEVEGVMTAGTSLGMTGGTTAMEKMAAG